MGFNRRYFSKELILREIDKDYPLKKYFASDACIFTDEVSHQAYQLHNKGVSDQEIKEFILKNSTPLIEQN
jgi:hypothetical protein